MAGKRYDAETHRGEIEAMIARGAGITEIASRLGVAHRTASRALAALGLVAPRGSIGPAARARMSASAYARTDRKWGFRCPPEHRALYRKLCENLDPRAARAEIERLIKSK